MVTLKAYRVYFRDIFGVNVLYADFPTENWGHKEYLTAKSRPTKALHASFWLKHIPLVIIFQSPQLKQKQMGKGIITMFWIC